MKRTIMIVMSIVLSITWASQPEQAQENKKKVLIISGDLNVPYEIIDGVGHVKTVKSVFVGNAFEKAIAEALKELQEIVKKSDGDAVINTSIQLAIFPAKTRTGEMGQVVIFGTLVRHK